jgi:hypothetical protein
VSASESTPVPDADLGSLDFWGLPAQERDRHFESLRRDAPVSRHEPPEDILGLPDQGRMHYWATWPTSLLARRDGSEARGAAPRRCGGGGRGDVRLCCCGRGGGIRR